MNKILITLSAAFFVLSLSTGDAVGCEGKSVTLKGVVQETKDGVYVDGVLIGDSALGEGRTFSRYIGKKVEVKGVVREVEAEDPNKGKDPSKDLIVQTRVGSWKVMEKIESITVLP